MTNIAGGNILLDADIILSKARIGENMKVADLGCGSTGHFVFPAAKILGKNGRVYAVDIMKTALDTIARKAGQENLKNVKTVWSNIEIFGATKIETEHLDVALLINTLHQSRKRVEILRETIRMMKRGGKLVIVEWKNTAIPFGPPSEERVNMDALISGGQKLGLRFEEEFLVGRYHYGLLFTKG